MAGGGLGNHYSHGGPAPQSIGCSSCGGTGYKESVETDNIRLRIYWNRKDWIRVADAVVVPNADAQVIGYMADYRKFQRADTIQLISDQTQGDWKFTKISEPVPHGFEKKRYFISYLKRA
jgi:hypothetical protein